MPRLFEQLRSSLSAWENMDFWVRQIPITGDYNALVSDLDAFRKEVAKAVEGLYQESRAADPARAERERIAAARAPGNNDPLGRIKELCQSIEVGDVEEVPTDRTEEVLFERIYAVDEGNFISRDTLSGACRSAIAAQPGARLRKVHTADMAWKVFDCCPPYVLCSLDDAEREISVFIYELHD